MIKPLKNNFSWDQPPIFGLQECSKSAQIFFEVKEGHPDFFTNNMIFLECGVIASFEAFYMFSDHSHVKMKLLDVK